MVNEYTFPAGVYVTPKGKSTNSGSPSSPLDLATALTKAKSPVKPGQTVWVRSGLYQGHFISTLEGTADLPIIVRAYPGERASVAGSISADSGGAVWFWGLEVYNPSTQRKSMQTGSAPTDIPIHDGIGCVVPSCKFINMAVHDALGNGFGLWMKPANVEVYGCLSYYNGWQAPDRAHGHGYYGQSADPRHISQNFIFLNYENGLQLYGSDNARIDHYLIEQNSFWSAGMLVLNGGVNVSIAAGGAPATDNTFFSNLVYHPMKQAYSLAIGKSSGGPLPMGLLDVRANYLAGKIQVANWQSIRFTNNTVLSNVQLVNLIENAIANPTIVWDSNVYTADADTYSFKYSGTVMDNKQWQAKGFDRNSTFTVASAWAGVRVFIQANAYEPGRGHITVFNWDHKSNVTVDLTGVVEVGQSFDVRNANDFFGPSVLTGVYNGPVTLPLTGLTMAQPVGQPAPPAPTAPEFAAYVVLPRV